MREAFTIKANYDIGLALDKCVVILNYICRLKRNTERAIAEPHC
jgi:hypothetical protein